MHVSSLYVSCLHVSDLVRMSAVLRMSAALVANAWSSYFRSEHECIDARGG